MKLFHCETEGILGNNPVCFMPTVIDVEQDKEVITNFNNGNQEEIFGAISWYGLTQIDSRIGVMPDVIYLLKTKSGLWGKIKKYEENIAQRTWDIAFVGIGELYGLQEQMAYDKLKAKE